MGNRAGQTNWCSHGQLLAGTGPSLLLSLALSYLLGSISFSSACILAFPPCFLTQSQNVPQCLVPARGDPTIPRLCRCPGLVPCWKSEAPLGPTACQCSWGPGGQGRS